MIGLLGSHCGPTRRKLFKIGQIVQHCRYGYRGVIVAADPRCCAGDAWYNANATQPDREQPWYHVLVDDSGGVSTYVAQTNLEPAADQSPLEHPRLEAYFEGYEEGMYQPRKSV